MSIEWPIIPHREYLKRLDLIKDTKQSDCIGTALYLAGMQQEDKIIQIADFHRQILAPLEHSDQPVPGWLTSFERKLPSRIYILHLAIVSQINPEPKLTSRDRKNGEILIDKSIPETRGLHIRENLTLKYYKP